jgi:hypothetical protein
MLDTHAPHAPSLAGQVHSQDGGRSDPQPNHLLVLADADYAAAPAGVKSHATHPAAIPGATILIPVVVKTR